MTSKRIVLLAIPILVMPLMGLNCGGGATPGPNPGEVIVQQCHANQINSYPGEQLEGDVYVDKPAECPISLPNPGNTNIEFSATAKFAIGTFWGHDHGSQLDILNYDGVIVKHTTADSWTIVNPQPDFPCTVGCSDHDVLYIGNIYPAGTSGYPVPIPEDQADIRVYRDGGLWHRYLGHLTYRNARGMTVSGPSEVMPETSFEVVASLNDPAFVPPITWQWSDNGVPLSYTSNRFMWPGSPMGTLHEFQVTVTDANGLSWTDTQQVWTKTCNTPGCADQ